MGEVAWWMVPISLALGDDGSGTTPAVSHVTKDGVGQLTGFAADTLTLVQFILGVCCLVMRSSAFHASLLLLGHQAAFGMADWLTWEDSVNSDQSFRDALSSVHVLPSARSGKVCFVCGNKPEKCPGQLNHTGCSRAWVDGNGRSEHE